MHIPSALLVFTSNINCGKMAKYTQRFYLDPFVSDVTTVYGRWRISYGFFTIGPIIQ